MDVKKNENVKLDSSFEVGDHLEGIVLGLNKHKNLEDSFVEIGLWHMNDEVAIQNLKVMSKRTIDVWYELVERLREEKTIIGRVTKHEVYGVIVDLSEKFYGLIENLNLIGTPPSINSNVSCEILGFVLDESKIQFSYISLKIVVADE